MSQRRIRAYRSGILAESFVALLLRLQGHRIVARRYKTPVGEIDLVALKGERLAFVEVKRRKRFEDAPRHCRAGRDEGSSEPRNIGLPHIPPITATTCASTWY